MTDAVGPKRRSPEHVVTSTSGRTGRPKAEVLSEEHPATFGEVPTEAKHRVSHRGLAARAARALLAG